MAEIFEGYLSLSISGGLLGLLVLCIRPVTKKFFSKKWAYYLWALVLLRLLLPMHIGAMEMNILGRLFLKASVVNAGRFGIAVFTHWMWAVWLAGIFFAIVWRIYNYQRFMRGVREDSILINNPAVLDAQKEVCKKLFIWGKVSVYENPTIHSPMLMGIIRPFIVLPSDMLAETENGANDNMLILYHEMVHYARKDIWYKWLFQLALCVHWFNPLVYLFNRRFNLDCELACDEAVMGLLSDDVRGAYGNVLLNAAEKSVGFPKNVPMMMLLEEKGTLKERLEGIAGYHRRGRLKRFFVGVCSTAVVLCLVIAFVVFGGASVYISPSGSAYDDVQWRRVQVWNYDY